MFRFLVCILCVFLRAISVSGTIFGLPASHKCSSTYVYQGFGSRLCHFVISPRQVVKSSYLYLLLFPKDGDAFVKCGYLYLLLFAKYENASLHVCLIIFPLFSKDENAGYKVWLFIFITCKR